MPQVSKREKKRAVLKKLYERFSKYKQIIIVSLDNVGSNQVQQIRSFLYKKNSELLIAKNTVIRKVLKMRNAELGDDQ
jgi:large subunit ribosomal protein LP0